METIKSKVLDEIFHYFKGHTSHFRKIYYEFLGFSKKGFYMRPVKII